MRDSGSVVKCGHMNKTPFALTDQEWEAVAAVPEVVEGFGLEEGEGAEMLKSISYGVRFEFVSDGPGYVGPLYLIKGAGSPGMPPIAVIERAGELVATRD